MRKVLTLLFCLVTFMVLQAQIRGNSIEVLVQPDHKDWTYKTGEKSLRKAQDLRFKNI